MASTNPFSTHPLFTPSSALHCAALPICNPARFTTSQLARSALAPLLCWLLQNLAATNTGKPSEPAFRKYDVAKAIPFLHPLSCITTAALQK
jgi:hypothetical protein